MHPLRTVSPLRRWVLSLTLVIALGLAGPVFSAMVLKTTIRTGSCPSSPALNPLTGRLYVANYYDGSTSVIDAWAESHLATLSAGGGLTIPNSIVVNPIATPPRAYVANFWNGTFNVIDEASLVVSATIPISGPHGAGAPRALAIDPSGATPKLYVAEYGADAVSVWNALTYEFITRIPVGDAPRALGIFSSLTHKRVYVANRYSHTVSIIDGETDSLIGNVSVGQAPKSIAIDTSTGWAWVTSEYGNSVTAINASDTVAGTVAVGVRPTGIAVDPSAGRVFVANTNSNSVSVLRTGNLTSESTLTVGSRPGAVAFDSGDSKAYVTCLNDDTVSIIDAGLSVSSVAVGDGPHALAIDEGSTPHKVFVANRDGNTLSVLGSDGLARNMLGFTDEAHAGPLPVAALTVDSATTDPITGNTVVKGTALSARRFPAALLDISLRVDGSGPWVPAAVVSGAGTQSVRWIALFGNLSQGSHVLDARVLDQTAAAASSSDSAGTDKGSAAAMTAPVPFSAGVVLSRQQGRACARCHSTRARGRGAPSPAGPRRCPKTAAPKRRR